MNEVALPLAVDLEACAAEPITAPGAIQPHGALLVVDPRDLKALHASANLLPVAGFELPLGASLETVEQTGGLSAELRRWLATDDPVFLRTLQVGRFVLQVFGHLTAQGLFLEFEDPPRSDKETLEGLYPRLRAFLASIANQPVLAIAEAAVREVRALTGFNRTLFYSFDEDGVGTVLAEDNDGALPSYLGLRFPAADIPAQARELYRLNRIRLIASSDYQPVPVEPALSPLDGAPLDLSLAALRSVSPVHLEYMRNMGTGSSMSLSLLVDGQLWGLISGHSAEPKYVNAQVRTACDILGQVLSLQIETREQSDRNAERLALREVETELLGKLALAQNYQWGLADNEGLWMALTRASGAAVYTADGVLRVGQTPPEGAIRLLAERLDGAEVAALDSIADAWPEAESFAAAASGVLAISISQIRPDYIMWFRPEAVRTVVWGGEPAKAADADTGRLHPRKSFDAWKQQVQLRSLPWRQAEIDSARGFRNAIQDLVLKRAEERAELTSQLEAINRELESFSYSISHDLRAPFRHIVGYAELLSERQRDLDPTSQHYLQSITDAAMSAGRLVDDLLNFSQLGRSSLTMGRVDLSKLVAEVRRSLEPDLIGREIAWRIEPLPQAWGDSAMLRQVLQNLLGNAVKYTRPKAAAEIAVEGVDLGDAVSVTVSDNGVGFDMTYVSKLFGVFQRLHRTEEFEGTGIGLALVKRIVDRHGGSIEARGAVGEGASFTITLPKRERAPGGEPRG